VSRVADQRVVSQDAARLRRQQVILAQVAVPREPSAQYRHDRSQPAEPAPARTIPRSPEVREHVAAKTVLWRNCKIFAPASSNSDAAAMGSIPWRAAVSVSKIG